MNAYDTKAGVAQKETFSSDNSKKLWEILVPVADNNGKLFKKKYHRQWDTKVVAIANGLTILSPNKGSWISSTGKLFREKMIPVRVACTKRQLENILGITADHYSQQAVMAYKISDEVLIWEK